MQSADVIAVFRSSGALLEGHFRLSSGLHSPGYLQCALVLQHPRDAERLGVTNPLTGGIYRGHPVPPLRAARRP